MVEGPGGLGPRGFRSSPPPNGTARKLHSPQEIRQGLESAKDELARGEVNRAAVSFSTVARWCMDRSRIGDRQAAIDWLTRSMEPRERAIDLFQQVKRPLDEALDHSFLGKAHSRLGVIQKNQRLLARGVFERTLALELFRRLGKIELQAGELHYLAEDFRSMGWLETDPQIKRYIFLKAGSYSDAALNLYPRYLVGEELEERKLREKGFSALAKGCAALCVNDPVEIRSAKDRCHSLADRLIKSGSDVQGYQLQDIARKLDKLWFYLSF